MEITKEDLEVLGALIGNVNTIRKEYCDNYDSEVCSILGTLVRQGNELKDKLEAEKNG